MTQIAARNAFCNNRRNAALPWLERCQLSLGSRGAAAGVSGKITAWSHPAHSQL